MTQEIELQIELNKTKELLEQTNRIAHIGSWEYDFITKIGHCSKITKEILELSDDSIFNIFSITKHFINKEDRNLIIRNLYNSKNLHQPFEIEIQIKVSHKNKKWVNLNVNSEFINNKYIRIFGIITDIDEKIKNKKELELANANFKFISENTSDSIVVFDKDQLVYVSPAFLKIFGYSFEDLKAMAEEDIFKFVHIDDIPKIKKLLHENYKKRITFSITYTYRFLHKNGKYIWKDDTLDVIYNEDKTIKKTIILSRDVSYRIFREQNENQRKESQLLQNEIIIKLSTSKFDKIRSISDKLNEIISSAAHGSKANRVSLWKFERDFLLCESIFIADTNEYKSGEKLSLNDFPKYCDAIKKGLFLLTNDVCNDSNTSELAASYFIPKGVTSLMDISIWVDGNIFGIVCFELTNEEQKWEEYDLSFAKYIVDIISKEIEADKSWKIKTELRKTKVLLEQSNRIAGIGGWEIDIIANEFYFSDLNYKIIEAPESYKLNINGALAFFKEGENRNKMEASIDNCLKYGTPFDIEVQIKSFKNNEKWVRAIGKAEFKNGRCTKLIGTFQDIDDKVKLYQVVQQKEQQYRTLISNISSVAFRCLADKEWTMIYISDAIESLTGYKGNEFIKKKINYLDLIHEDDFLLVNDKSINTSVFEYYIEYRIFDKNKKQIWVSEKGKRYFDKKENTYLIDGIITNITEQKAAENKLINSQRQLNSILNSLDEVVWAIDLPNRKPMFISNSFERIFDISSDKWFQNFESWKTVLHPNDQLIGEKIENDTINYGQAHETFRIINVNGETKYLENTVKILYNESNIPYMVIGIIIDVTEKKRIEFALKKSEKETEIAIISKAELEPRALQMQMNPHFIFNVLNSIQSFILNKETIVANDYLSKFSKLIRLFLDSSRSKFISINEEINLLTLYMELEKLRFEDKFEYEIEIKGPLNKYFEIPTMIVQPFIENAINHGLRYKKEKGKLKIIFTKQAKYVICTIEDDGIGRTKVGKIQHENNKGYKSQGIKITTERIEIYNKINNVKIEFALSDKIQGSRATKEDVGTVVKVKFPI